jgi:hypothetical protein
VADQIREEARRVSIRGTNIMSNMKYHLTSQLLDPKLRTHIMVKEEWSERMFDKVDWSSFETAFKRLSKNRQTVVSKSCHNLWHTGKLNGCIYQGNKSCCFCDAEEEDWNYFLTCGSLDATMTREASRAKVKKVMEMWKMSPGLWTAIEKGIQHYTRNASQNNKGSASPFPRTFNNPRNLLRQALRG